MEKEVDRIVVFGLRDRERLGHVDFESLKVESAATLIGLISL
jgi:hypothetical protein